MIMELKLETFLFQASLNYQFSSDLHVSLKLTNGSGPVHLTGYAKTLSRYKRLYLDASVDTSDLNYVKMEDDEVEDTECNDLESSDSNLHDEDTNGIEGYSAEENDAEEDGAVEDAAAEDGSVLPAAHHPQLDDG